MFHGARGEARGSDRSQSPCPKPSRVASETVARGGAAGGGPEAFPMWPRTPSRTDTISMPSGPRSYVPVPGVPDYEGESAEHDGHAPRAGAVPPVASAESDAAAAASRPAPPEASPEASETPAAEPLLPTGPPDTLLRSEAAVDPAATSSGPHSGDPSVPAEPSSEAERADRAPLHPDRGLQTPAASVAPVVQTAKEAAGERTRELVEIVTRYGKRHLPAQTPRQVAPTEPPRLVGRLAQVLPVMRAIPVVLVVAFAASFAWDFPGAEVTLFGRALSVEGLMRTLAVSGLIGYLTNWLAITMLFQPREKRAIIPQGLIPAQRERVIYRLAQAISQELINADIIKQRIQESGVIGRYRDLALGVVRGVVEDPGFRAELKDLAQGYATDVLGSEDVRRELAKLAAEKVEQQAGQGLGGVALRLYRTFAEDDFQRRIDRALRELPESVTPLLDRIDTALDGVPARVEARADEIEDAATRAVLSFVEGFDVQAMILDKARGFDESQLENLLKSTSNEQLNYIKYLGGILGVLGGFVIWQPVLALVTFVTAGLVLWGLDEALVRARRA